MLADSTLHDIEAMMPAEESFCQSVSHALWGEQLLTEKRKRSHPWDVYCLDSVTSTMEMARWLCKDEARGLVRSRISAFSDPHVPRSRDERPLLIVAREQTRGRGRKGRVWQSTKDNGVYVTYLLFPHVPPRRLVGFSLVIGLAVRAALESFGVHPKLKWPNDILVAVEGNPTFQKLGGVLTEMIPRDDDSFAVSIGIGINMRKSAGLASVGALSIEDVIVWELPYFDLLRVLSEQVAEYSQRFFQGGFRQFATEWQGVSIMQDRAVRVVHERGEYSGTVRGISEDGGLIIERQAADGTLETITVYAGDVLLADVTRN